MTGFLLVALLAPALRATIVVPPEFSDLVNKSDYVVRARVKSSTSEFRSSPGRTKIYTKVELEVLEVITGQPPATVVLEFLGGRVGDEELIVDGAPQPQVGEEGIFFVSNNGKAFCPLYAMGYGHYLVKEDAATKQRYVARDDNQPMQSVAEVSQPLRESAAAAGAAPDLSRALSPEDFAQRIREAVRTGGQP